MYPASLTKALHKGYTASSLLERISEPDLADVKGSFFWVPKFEQNPFTDAFTKYVLNTGIFWILGIKIDK